MSGQAEGCINWREFAEQGVPESFRVSKPIPKPATPPTPQRTPAMGTPIRWPSHERGKMNKLEARYAAYLEGLRLAGEILNWLFEPFKLQLARNTSYTPDFWVVMPDGSIEIHETKGFMEDDAAVKLKVAAQMYPSAKFKLVRRIRGEWKIRQILPE